MKYDSFAKQASAHGSPLVKDRAEVVQVNLGKKCNQACKHCHVEAGPNGREQMDLRTMDRALELLARTDSIATIDITGGAPELNPHFKRLVSGARALQMRVLDRCNLTVLLENGQHDTVGFLAENEVSVIASLPCYTAENVNAQRGKGVFDKSIRALKLLNGVGYGRPGSSRELILVYNPGGNFLPAPQQDLEMDYRRELGGRFGVEFTSLYTIANMPIGRFERHLNSNGQFESYMDLLQNSFNPRTLPKLMCRSMISIGWDGRLYDCDFNQTLDLGVEGMAKTLWDIWSFDDVLSAPIGVANHCYGCTAGAGSSCGGTLS
jgi:radical SAM/Cys-rich protein